MNEGVAEADLRIRAIRIRTGLVERHGDGVGGESANVDETEPYAEKQPWFRHA
jgi:hypothetical protein